jgi:hypothetical protein
MHSQWLKTEHDRLHIIESWPDGSLKEAALAAIQSKLASFARNAPANALRLDCETCLNRQRSLGVVSLHLVPQAVDQPMDKQGLAA